MVRILLVLVALVGTEADGTCTATLTTASGTTELPRLASIPDALGFPAPPL